jgi:hypothetical protein
MKKQTSGENPRFNHSFKDSPGKVRVESPLNINLINSSNLSVQKKIRKIPNKLG